MSEQKSKTDALLCEYERLKLTMEEALLAANGVLPAIGEDGWRTHDPELLSARYQAAERALDDFVERLVDSATTSALALEPIAWMVEVDAKDGWMPLGSSRYGWLSQAEYAAERFKHAPTRVVPLYLATSTERT